MASARPDSRHTTADWSAYVPAAQRRRVLLERRLRRILALLTSRRSVLLSLLGIYLLICLAVLRSTATSVAILALAPLLFPPALGLLAYWLVWSDYHR